MKSTWGKCYPCKSLSKMYHKFWISRSLRSKPLACKIRKLKCSSCSGKVYVTQILNVHVKMKFAWKRLLIVACEWESRDVSSHATRKRRSESCQVSESPSGLTTVHFVVWQLCTKPTFTSFVVAPMHVNSI